MSTSSKEFRNETYDTFKKENRLKLFGCEDAGKEDQNRLNSYYYKTVQYEDIMSDIKFQIITGEKGTGKSALIKIALYSFQLKDSDTVPIFIRMDDLAELNSKILDSENLYHLKTLWKRSISKLTMMNLFSQIGGIVSEDLEKVANWAYESGYAARDFIALAIKKIEPSLKSYIDLNDDSESIGEHHVMKRLIKNQKICLFFDDFDLDWHGKKSEIVKIKSLLLSLSDMTSDIDNFYVRIALRTDVYEMIRQEEFSDKFESALIKCQWNNQEIMKALAKRICAYFGMPFNEDSTADNATLQYNIVQYLNYIFVENFDDKTRVWAKAPTHRVIYSLIRRKPRDMVKLCQSVAEVAYKKKQTIIDSSCFLSVLELYSQERLKDLVNEYSNQLPNLNSLLLRMATTKNEIQLKKNERYVYSTDELYLKIKNIQNNVRVEIYDSKSEKVVLADFHEIAHFLYKIGFITGRKRGGDNKIIRAYYDEMPFLLSNKNDKGYSWEIHPAYRGALTEGGQDNWISTFNPIE